MQHKLLKQNSNKCENGVTRMWKFILTTQTMLNFLTASLKIPFLLENSNGIWAKQI